MTTHASTTLLLGIGTNLGDRAANLQRAVTLIGRYTTVTAVSSIYQTPPWGVTDQPDFLNACISAETTQSPQQLLKQFKEIEQMMGREQSMRWGPRLIDIDILFYGSEQLDIDTLTIPHKRLHERAFVLVPLADIAGDFIHPVLQKSVGQLMDDLPNEEIVRSAETLTIPPKPPVAWGKRTYIMGILNATPDSFSGDGFGREQDVVATAVAQAKQMVADGADILDIGGESTKPGGVVVDAAEEQRRILPVIEAVRAAVDVPLSADTYRASTAAAALKAGANWINDIWGLIHDPELKNVAAEANCPVVIMHNGRNRERQELDDGAGGYYGYYHYEDVIAEVVAELKDQVKLALAAGIADHNIIIDPGVGFGKTGDQNLRLVNELDALKEVGYPILLGTSRKGFIGHTLGGLPADDRVEGNAAVTTVGILRGADIVRVHEVKEMARVARMTDALVRK